MDYQFRNALNGFHKEDVVAYLEATNQAHQAKLQRLQNQIASADERYAELESKEAKYMEKISDLEAEISTIKIESGVQIANYQDAENNDDEVTAVREEMEEFKRAAKECAASMSSMQEEYEAQIEDLEWQLTSVKEKYEAVGGDGGRGDESEEMEALESQVRQLKGELADAKAAANNAPAGLSDDVRINEMQDEIYVLEDEVTALRQKLSEYEVKIALADDHEEAPAANHNVTDEQRITELQDEIYVLEDEVDALQAKLKEALANASAQEEAPDAADNSEELEKARDEVKTAQIRLENMAKTIDELENALDDNEAELKQLKAKINAGETSPVPVAAPTVVTPVVESGEELNSAKLEISSLSLKLQESTDRAEEAEHKLDSLSQTIADLEFTAQGYDARTQQLLSRLDNVERENQRLASLQDDDSKSQLEDQVQDLREKLTMVRESEQSLKNQLETATDTIKTLEAAAISPEILAERDALDLKLKETEAKLEVIDTLEAKLKESEEKILVLHQLEEKLTAAHETITDLQQLEGQLATTKTDLANLSQELEAKETKLEESVALLSEKDGLLAEKQSQLADKTALVREQEQDLDEKNSLLEEKDSLLKEKDGLLAEKQTQLANKEAMMREKDKYLTEKDILLEENKNTISSLQNNLSATQEEVSVLPKLRNQLKESQEELEAFSKTKSQLREAREELETMSRMKAQLRDAQEELEMMSKMKSQLNDVNAELEIASKYKAKLNETKEELDIVTTRLKSTEEKLEDMTNEEIKKLKEGLNELELSFDDEKRYNATLITELDDLRVELTKRKNTEWSLQEDLKKVQMSHDVLEHKVKRLEPPAKAYLSIKDRVENMEREAQFRAQETISQAENEVFRVQQQVEQWLARVNTSYSSLCKELDENIVTVDQGLARASNALSQISSVIKTQDSAFSHLGRTISATSSAPNHNIPQEEPIEAEETWTTPTMEWEAPPVPTPNWSTSTIPNSASPADWSTAPSPLPIEDVKPLDLYEELEALEFEELD